MPQLSVVPVQVELPYGIEISGSEWGDCPLRLLIDGDTEPARLRLILGESMRDRLLRPVGGEFVAVVDAPGLKPGSHTIQAIVVSSRPADSAEAAFEVLAVAELDQDGRPTLRPQRRRIDFNARRFPAGVAVPGSRLRALTERDAMRLRQAEDPNPPVSPGCNWYPIGPSVVRNGQVFSTTPTTYTTAPISGRVAAIAIDPNDVQTIFAATAQGGLWKSVDSGRNWEPKTDFSASLACGAVTIDPSVTDAFGRSTRIIVGTGEPNNSDSYYGAGILLSTDGGDTWATRGTTTFLRAAFSRIAVDTGDSHHFLAAADTGVYESFDEGANWTMRDSGAAFDLCVDWAGAGGVLTYVARSGVGVRRRVGTGAFTTLGGGLPSAGSRLALAMAPSASGTLYAAIPSGGTVTFYRTTDGGTTWSTTGGTVTGSQLTYNLTLAIHPSDPNTLLFGEVHLWRSTNAGGNWTRVSTGSPGIHADQHAVVFDPSNGSRVFAGNDGGAWESSDGGITWVHRNKDLATLQYFGSASHGRFEAIALGGSQDNGAQRYAGHPAWEHSALGDGAFCAIDTTSDPHRWYETRWYSFPCFRSDSSGAAASWVAKQSGITTNNNWFYPPFMMDPNDSTVLYSGFDRLFRSSNRGDAWTAITGVLVSGQNITAIAAAPSNSGILYVGLQGGQVFRVTGSGTTWTANDISSGPIPAGQISDVAVHPTDPNTVYVTTSDLIFSEGSESFSANHVFRTTNGTTWTSVSAGLSPANPVNTIVVDPANPQTVFIGADVGIFRSDNGGTTWTAWDQGLPNCSVQHLELLAPHRLLRAATHGRSVWERPIDAALCSAVSLYMRDNLLDTGRTTPSPSGEPHPFDATQWVYWWQSADIKIDSPDAISNQYAYSGLNIDYLQFEDHQHDNPRRGTFVRVYAQVHARGTQSATNVRVRAFWASAGAGLPPLPGDFWMAFPNADPIDMTNWHPIGPTRTIPSVGPGRPAVAGWSWQVPSTAPTHTCLLVVVTSAEDPISASGTDVGAAIQGSRHVTLKNLHVDNVVPGATGADTPAGPYMIELAVGDDSLPTDIRFNTRGLPVGSVLHIALPEFKAIGGMRRALRGVKAVGEAPKPLRELQQYACEDPVKFNWAEVFALEVPDPEDLKRNLPGLYGLWPAVPRFAAAFTVTLPDVDFDQPLTFHVEQWIGERLIGGSTYELRPARR